MKEYKHLKQVEKQWSIDKNVYKMQCFYQKGNRCYDSFYGHRQQVRQKRILQYLDDLQLQKGSKILELGYAAGMAAVEVLKRGFNISGVDISERFRKLATKNCQQIRTDATFDFRVGNAEKLDFPNDHFDCVIELAVLHYLENPLDCMKEVHRVLKPGGYFMLSQRNKYGIGCLDSSLKTLRGLIYLTTKREYELMWANTFLIHPAIMFSSLFSPLSKTIRRSRDKLIAHRDLGLVKKRAFSFNDLKKMLEKSNFKVIRYDGSGYLSKTCNRFFPGTARRIDDYLQNANDKQKIPGIHHFGNSVVFLAQKK